MVLSETYELWVTSSIYEFSSERDEIDQEHKWDIESLYDSKEQWESDREQIEQSIEVITKFEAQLTDSPEKLFEALELYEEIRTKLSNLSRYASMKSDEDTRKQEYQKLSSRADSLSAKVSSKTSFIEPEIQDLSKKTSKVWLKKTRARKIQSLCK